MSKNEVQQQQNVLKKARNWWISNATATNTNGTFCDWKQTKYKHIFTNHKINRKKASFIKL